MSLLAAGLDLTQIGPLAGALLTLGAAIGAVVKFWPDRSGKLLENAETYAEKYVRLADQDAARVRINAAEEIAKARLEAEARVAEIQLHCDAERAKLEDQLTRLRYDRDYLAAKLIQLGESLEP